MCSVKRNACHLTEYAKLTHAQILLCNLQVRHASAALSWWKRFVACHRKDWALIPIDVPYYFSFLSISFKIPVDSNWFPFEFLLIPIDSFWIPLDYYWFPFKFLLMSIDFLLKLFASYCSAWNSSWFNSYGCPFTVKSFWFLLISLLNSL